jgi:PrtD family type I secretion system ABC transporter
MKHPLSPPESSDALQAALRRCRGAVAAVVFFSLCINLLMLTAPLYMLQVFDRVLNSRSEETLMFLTLIAVVAFVALGAVEAVRHLMLSRIGGWMDREVSGELLKGTLGRDLGAGAGSVQSLRDLATLRGFISGPAVFPLLDAPWLPIFVVVIFLLHPWLGWLAIGGSLVLLALAVVTELATARPYRMSNAASVHALDQADAAVRNADVVQAMGMAPALLGRWERQNGAMLALLDIAHGRGGAIKSVSRFLRMSLQIAILGVGAWLVLAGEMTPGAMIAGSILFARALAPVDQAIGSWRSATSARAAYKRITAELREMPLRAPAMALPAPEGRLTVQNITYFHPGADAPALHGISFELAPGESLGVIGPTAVGKTTLARMLVGNLKPRAGHVRLDGADVADWDPADVGPHIGYLPQDIELFAGTVRENIARMSEGEPETIVAAARAAGVHDLILHLADGYETEIGGAGMALSGGQRQRIALARALYGDPALIVLDEPNANLDQPGEEALAHVIDRLKERRATSVLVTHRMWILRRVDKILVLGTEGAMFGDRDQILAKIAGPQIGQPAQPAPAREPVHA